MRRAIWMRGHVAQYQAKYPKVVASLVANWDRLLTFFGFPAEHWKHMRTTNLTRRGTRHS